MHRKTFPLVITAFGAAIIAVMAQIIIPLPVIPITGQTLAVGLVVTILGLKYGTLSVLLYILLGAIGLPVFKGFTGGLGILVGPTGGYIIGFLAQAYVMGLYLRKFGISYFHGIIANIIGTIITLSFGTVWLKLISELSWETAFWSGTAPFIIVGIIKAVLAAWFGVILRKRLESANLLRNLNV